MLPTPYSICATILPAEDLDQDKSSACGSVSRQKLRDSVLHQLTSLLRLPSQSAFDSYHLHDQDRGLT